MATRSPGQADRNALPPVREILFAGNYDPDFNRTAVMTEGLAKLGVKVVHFPFESKRRRTARQLVELGRRADFVLVPCFAHQQVRFIKRHLPGKLLMFDPLVSKYMTKILDYRQSGRFTVTALHNWLKDKVSLSAADIVLCDTHAHAAYYRRRYGVDARKLRVVPVGVNTELYRPDAPGRAFWPEADTFRVGFYGGMIPLQGAPLIVSAARLLQAHADISFELIGTGAEYKAILRDLRRRPLERMHLPGWVPQEDLNRYINAYDLCLGIFGRTPKADLVIPNKVYHYAACGKPFITKDTPAIREVFSDGVDAAFVAATAEALAGKILALKAQSRLRQELGRNARLLMEREYSEVRIAERVLAAYRDWVAGVRVPLPEAPPERFVPGESRSEPPLEEGGNAPGERAAR